MGAMNGYQDSIFTVELFPDPAPPVSSSANGPPPDVVPDSYDRLDFTRPVRELKPHYHSTSTLRSRGTSSNRNRCVIILSL